MTLLEEYSYESALRPHGTALEAAGVTPFPPVPAASQIRLSASSFSTWRIVKGQPKVLNPQEQSRSQFPQSLQLKHLQRALKRHRSHWRRLWISNVRLSD